MDERVRATVAPEAAADLEAAGATSDAVESLRRDTPYAGADRPAARPELLVAAPEAPSIGTLKTVLNAGSGPRDPKRLHPMFRAPQWSEVTLDIDPSVKPDRIGSVTDMRGIFTDAAFDAVWSSHNLEHLFAPDVLPALREFKRILKPTGFALITCPNIEEVARLLLDEGLQYQAYESAAGPITVHDMIFGHSRSIEAGHHFMAHNTGFTHENLGACALEAGFPEARVGKGPGFTLWSILLMEQTDPAEIDALLRDTDLAFLMTEIPPKDLADSPGAP